MPAVNLLHPAENLQHSAAPTACNANRMHFHGSKLIPLTQGSEEASKRQQLQDRYSRTEFKRILETILPIFCFSFNSCPLQRISMKSTNSEWWWLKQLFLETICAHCTAQAEQEVKKTRPGGSKKPAMFSPYTNRQTGLKASLTLQPLGQATALLCSTGSCSPPLKVKGITGRPWDGNT